MQISNLCGEGLRFEFSMASMILMGITILLTLYFLRKDTSMKSRLITMGILLLNIGLYGAADFYTSYIFFEMIGIAALFWCLDEENRDIGKRWMYWVVLSGMILTFGMFVKDMGGNFRTIAGICYLIGYGSRLGMTCFHGWISSILKKMTPLHKAYMLILIIPGGIWQLYKVYPVFYQHTEFEELLLLLGIGTIILYVLDFLVKVRKDHYFEHVFSHISFEYLVYQPVFGIVLPFTVGLVFRIIDYLPDMIVAGLRGSVYQDSKQKVWDKVGTPFTYVLGTGLDEVFLILHKTIWKNHKKKPSFVNGLAVARKEWEATRGMVTKSVSFGLLMFGIGMCITLVYLFL